MFFGGAAISANGEGGSDVWRDRTGGIIMFAGIGLMVFVAGPIPDDAP